MALENLKKIEDVMKAINQFSISKEDFEKSFESIVNLVLRREEHFTKVLNNFEQLVNNITQKLQSEQKKGIDDLKKQVDVIMKKEHKQRMDEIFKKMATIKDGIDGRDGKDADEETIVKNVLDKIPKPELPILEGEDRPDIGSIKGLRSIIEELKIIRGRKLGGGGFSKIAMDGHIIDGESLSGTKNGTNKIFTILNAPNPVASLHIYRGGARQEENPSGTTDGDYSISGKTITFNSAPASPEILKADYRH